MAEMTPEQPTFSVGTDLSDGKLSVVVMKHENGTTWVIHSEVIQLVEQQPISAYTCTVPDDCETLHWRGQILSMNELVSVAQPAVDEEIHVHIEGRDVLTLPLASSGMSAPRVVVHVPAQQPAEQQPAPDVTQLVEAIRLFISRVERIAMSMKAPNIYTPQLMEASVAMRAALCNHSK